MRMGLFPDLSRSVGGIYQYSLTILSALLEWTAEGCGDEFVVLTENRQHPALQQLRRPAWSIAPSEPRSLRLTGKRVVTRLGMESAARDLIATFRSKRNHFDVDRLRSRPHDRQWLSRLGLELALYPSPQTRSFEIGLPYIMAVHDLQHRLQPEFPEVSANGEWEYREYLFRNGAKYATSILADSETGKDDILNFYAEYGVRPERVKVLPFLPAVYLPSDVPDEERSRVSQKYNLPERFLFYPAQFWPHKNHLRIIRALGLLKDRHLQPCVVFCGSSEGSIRKATLKEAMTLAHKMGVTHQIVNLSYVPDEDMSGLYAAAAALVMPTFFGPTNIPILEAWRFGCPVITSDIRGIREQAGDAAILVDPKSEESIAEAIQKMWTDTAICERLAGLGRRRLGEYTPADFRRRLIAIIQDAKSYAIC